MSDLWTLAGAADAAGLRDAASMLGQPLHPVRLAGPDDVDGALAALSRLLADGVAPQAVRWHDGQLGQAGLFDDEAAQAAAVAAPPRPQAALAPRQSAAADPLAALPADALALVRQALLNDDAGRWPLVHGWLARLHDDPRHWHDRLHPDRLQLERLAREVRREIHKMHAFVRFRPVQGEGDTEPRHVAWFEPAHPVVRAAAPFFQRRFAAMHWAILTPRGSVAWDRRTLQHGPPAQRADAPPPDAGEALWLAYYRSIFNPARLKPAMMRREMPVRFWRNLPEAAAIAPLLRDANQRTAGMVAHAADTQRRLPRPMAAAVPPEQARARLRTLAAQAAACQACPQAGRATHTVFGRGAAPAALMVVGEQPGDHEDQAGRPFVGPAGQWLQQAIAALGWPLQRLYVTNAVKHFHHTPRGKRRLHKTPAQAAIAACLDWLEAEIAVVDPPVIVALGATAARALLGDAAPPPTAGACVPRPDGRLVHVLPHPASLLRAGHTPDGAAALAWRDRLARAGQDATWRLTDNESGSLLADASGHARTRGPHPAVSDGDSDGHGGLPLTRP